LHGTVVHERLPVKAYTKDPATGIVLHSADTCIGCQYCTWNCSYGVPQYNAERDVVGPEPNTWREIITAVAERPERQIAVQEYGRLNTPLHDALRALGAEVTPVALYRWELPHDLQPLRQAVARVAGGGCDVVLFTSSIQLEHLLHIAASMGLEAEVRSALKERIVVGSIGPVMNDALDAQGIRPDVVPRHPKMWALVKAAAEQSAAVMASKAA
jgi:uroporphyrinogen-III synthase